MEKQTCTPWCTLSTMARTRLTLRLEKEEGRELKQYALSHDLSVSAFLVQAGKKVGAKKLILQSPIIIPRKPLPGEACSKCGK